MDRRDALQLLGLAPDEPLTHDRLRRAYLRRLRVHPPERDPDGFRRLRAAFEMLEQTARMEAFLAQLPREPLPSDGRGADEPVSLAANVRGDKADVREARDEHDEHDERDDKASEHRARDEHDDKADEHHEVPGEPDDEPDDEADDEADDEYDDEPGEPGELRSLTEVTDEIIACLERDQLDAARDLCDHWNRSALDDHRVVSPYIAQRWALVREVLEVAPALSSSLRRALAHSIARDDMLPARRAAQAFALDDPEGAHDLVKHLAKRAPSLHSAVGPWFDADRAQPGTPRAGWSWWHLWAILIIISAVSRAVGSCEGSSSDPREIAPPVQVDERVIEQLEERARRIDRGTPRGTSPLRLETELFPGATPDGTATRTP